MNEFEEVSTTILSDELSKREGVDTIEVNPYEKVKITTEKCEIEFTGPAVILVNTD